MHMHAQAEDQAATMATEQETLVAAQAGISRQRGLAGLRAAPGRVSLLVRHGARALLGDGAYDRPITVDVPSVTSLVTALLSSRD